MATNYSLALHAMTQVRQRKTLTGNKQDYELLSHLTHMKMAPVHSSTTLVPT